MRVLQSIRKRRQSHAQTDILGQRIGHGWHSIADYRCDQLLGELRADAVGGVIYRHEIGKRHALYHRLVFWISQLDLGARERGLAIESELRSLMKYVLDVRCVEEYDLAHTALVKGLELRYVESCSYASGAHSTADSQ